MTSLQRETRSSITYREEERGAKAKTQTKAKSTTQKVFEEACSNPRKGQLNVPQSAVNFKRAAVKVVLRQRRSLSLLLGHSCLSLSAGKHSYIFQQYNSPQLAASLRAAAAACDSQLRCWICLLRCFFAPHSSSYLSLPPFPFPTNTDCALSMLFVSCVFSKLLN